MLNCNACRIKIAPDMMRDMRILRRALLYQNIGVKGRVQTHGSD